MRVLVSGSTGLIGRALLPVLERGGHEVVRLVRGRPVGRADIPWNPDSPQALTLLRDELERVRPDAVIHLAGHPIAAGRWTPEHKRLIRESRVRDTSVLARALAALPHPPHAFVAASAIGYYGDRGVEELTEESPSGTGYLAEVGVAWEAAARPAAEAGIRVVTPRIGLVLSREGGALRAMLPAFRLGLGGPLGSGRQYMSWIAMEDMVRILASAVDDPALSGVYNTVSPYPVVQADFARTLGRVLRRPAVLPAPAWALRLLVGEMADALLLSSTRVVPARLKQAGFSFRHASLEDALREILGRA